MIPRPYPAGCPPKVKELIAEAVSERDLARREGLLMLADQWIDIARRREDERVTALPKRSASLRDS